jgi:hypothetical protein
MRKHCQPRRSGLWWATADKGTAQSIIDDIGKRITTLQGKYGLSAYSVKVFEASGGLHCHIVFIGNPKITERLKNSQFGPIIEVRRIRHPDVVRNYLVKERTPQGGYRRNHMLGGRLKGSHQLRGGGDRVRLSEALECDAVNAGYVEPWVHSNVSGFVYQL